MFNYKLTCAFKHNCVYFELEGMPRRKIKNRIHLVHVNVEAAGFEPASYSVAS